jgi:hypothetical protein
VPLVAADPFRHHPPRWRDFEKYAVATLALFRSRAAVYRFCARYRLAKAFQGMNLDGYTQPTADGYSALTRLAFTWSAFEGLTKALGQSAAHYASRMDPAAWGDCLAALRAMDPTYRVFGFVRRCLTKKTEKAEVDKFLLGNPCSGVILACAVRNIFLHGDLTPNADQCPPPVMAAVCDRLTTALFRVMDREFRECVEQMIFIVRQL